MIINISVDHIRSLHTFSKVLVFAYSLKDEALFVRVSQVIEARLVCEFVVDAEELLVVGCSGGKERQAEQDEGK